MESVSMEISLSEKDVKMLYQMGDHYSTLRARVIDALALGLKMSCNEDRKTVEKSLNSITKSRLVELLLQYYDEGKVSLCSLEMPAPQASVSADKVKLLSDLLEAYKQKVDELLPDGEIFAPDIYLS